jgi:hypothetical protein
VSFRMVMKRQYRDFSESFIKGHIRRRCAYPMRNTTPCSILSCHTILISRCLLFHYHSFVSVRGFPTLSFNSGMNGKLEQMYNRTKQPVKGRSTRAGRQERHHSKKDEEHPRTKDHCLSVQVLVLHHSYPLSQSHASDHEAS